MQIDKPGHWLSLFKSFDPRFYPKIASQSFGRSLAYLLLLSFVLSSVVATKYIVDLSNLIPKFNRWISTHSEQMWPSGLDEVKLENGQVSSNTKQPFVYNWDDFVLVLDTTGEIKNLDSYAQGVLILKDRIFLKENNFEGAKQVNEYNLPKSDSFIVRRGDPNKDIIAQIVSKGNSFDITIDSLRYLLKIFFIALFFVNMFLLFLYYVNSKIAYALGLFVTSFLMNKIIKANLRYNNLVNISVYALTPAAVLALLVFLLKIQATWLWAVYPLICVIYLIYGIRMVKDGGAGCLT